MSEVPPVKQQPRVSSSYPMSFAPQLVERSNMVKLTHLSKDEIIERLEEERFHRLHKAASNLKADMMSDERCPLCTLQIPCKHFESLEQLYAQRSKLFNKQEWSMLSQDNRNSIIKLKLKLQKCVKEARFKARDELDNKMQLQRADSAINHQTGRISASPMANGHDSQPTFRVEQEPEEQPQQNELSDANRDLEMISASHQRSGTYQRQFSQSSYNMTGGVGRKSNTSRYHHGVHAEVSTGNNTQSMHSNAAESFLLKIRINALKNKIGFRNLTNEQRAELQERIEQETFNYHFEKGVDEDRTAVEQQLEQEEMALQEQSELRQRMHPWHGKSKQERKEYIEKLLLNFKSQQIVQEKANNAKAVAHFNASKRVASNSPPKSRKRGGERQAALSAVTGLGRKKRRRTQSKHAGAATDGGRNFKQMYNTIEPDQSTGMGLNRYDFREIKSP